MKPIAAHAAIADGIPQNEKPFWKQMPLDELYSLYVHLTATPSRVLDMIEEPDFVNCTQEQVFSYLREFIGNFSVNETRTFLRFVTGSSVLSSFPPQGYVQ